jgi:hypothetical protein
VENVTSRRDTETVEARLARLRDATEALAPPVGFDDRVAGALRGRRGLAAVVLPFGRRALAVAALAAAASVALAFQSERSAELASSDDVAWWEP